jgi:hypothetical protein
MTGPFAGEPTIGLRARLWAACLAGTLVCGAGLWWVFDTWAPPGLPVDRAALALGSLVSLLAGLGVSLISALWIDLHVVRQLRMLVAALASGRAPSLRQLPAATGWGELSALAPTVQDALARQRQLARAADDLQRLEHQLAELRVQAERWMRSERWQAQALAGGPAAELAASLDRGFARDLEVRDQNLEAARLIRAELDQSREDARESVEQAERGFVEATSLLTTVRELQRLGAELAGVLAHERPAAADGPAGEPADATREAMGAALEDLVQGTVGIVEDIGQGLARVQEIGDQVRLLANRATLIALDVTVPREPGGLLQAEVAAELRLLARDVRAATDRTEALSHEVATRVHTAGGRMSELRARVAERLATLPAPALPPARAEGPRADDVRHLLERVQEMIRDATRKGERLSASGERASRAAERLVRRLEEQTREFDGLVVRLGPPGALPEEPRLAAEPAPDAPAATFGLRLLEREDPAPPASGGTPEGTPPAPDAGDAPAAPGAGGAGERP